MDVTILLFEVVFQELPVYFGVKKRERTGRINFHNERKANTAAWDVACSMCDFCPFDLAICLLSWGGCSERGQPDKAEAALMGKRGIETAWARIWILST
jgi:hypothetical protein